MPLFAFEGREPHVSPGAWIAPTATLVGAVLVGANLSDADLRKADLTDADLTRADLRNADLAGAILAHATLEPMNNTVWLRDGKCEAWCPTQDGQGAREGIAKILGVPEKNVTVHVTFMGGGFGRRFGGPFDRQAIQV